MDESQTTQVEDQPQRGPRWFQRLLPMTLLLLVVVALAAYTLPGFREQVKVSTTRQPQSFVELYFARTAPEAMCGRGDDGDVRFTLVSHLKSPQRLAYQVTVDPGDTRKASVRIRPGAERTVRAAVEAPEGGGFTVTVRLPGRDQQIRAHCSGRRP